MGDDLGTIWGRSRAKDRPPANPLKNNDETDVDGGDDLLRTQSLCERDGPRVCAQCGLDPPDGREQFCSVEGKEVWLHPACQGLFLRQEGPP
jgi:hypothetical protein